VGHRGAGKTRRLADLISRYGEAIERDLQRIYGVDLGEYWRDLRRHRKLANLVDGLPGDSAFAEAMANDPAAAAAVADGRIRVRPEPTGPRLTEWSAERAALADICDRLTVLTIAVLASGGAKQLPKFKPTPRPSTAMDEALRSQKWRAAQQEADEIARLFVPHEFADEPAPTGG
jgi:hypothetical protein